MTVITNLRLKNFKSFKKAEIPFAQGFTAIAGANGSGKSNILDAILFAMGTTSLKLIRASRLTELVNNDSNEGYAKAELVLKDQKGKQITITRIVDTQGRSIFKIDDKKKTLNEVQSLLLELGVNPNGHNIVVQGDVTRVIEMNAKQRLQVIEEVAGLQEFEEKKHEALKKLDEVEQKVKDAMLVLNERENYLHQIEVDRNNAIRYNELLNQLRRSKATIISEELRLTRVELELAEKRIDRIKKEVDETRQERSGLQEEEIQLEQKAEELTKRLIDSAERNYSGFGKETEKRHGHINLLNEKAQAKNSSIEWNAKRLAEMRSEISSTDRMRKEKEEQLGQAKKALQKAMEEITLLNNAIRSKSPEFDKKRKEMSGKEERVAQIQTELDSLREQLHPLLLEKHGLERDTKAARDAFAELQGISKRLEEKVAAKKEAEKKARMFSPSDIKPRLEGKERELAKIISDLNYARGKVEGLDETLSIIARSRGACPTCEKPLAKEIREKIVARKTKEAGELKQRIKALEPQLEKTLSEKAKLQADDRAASEALALLKGFQGVEDELSIARQKTQSSNELLSSKKPAELQARENELRKKMDALEKEKGAMQQALDLLRKSEASMEMGQLLSKIQELNEKKAEQEKAVTRLTTEIDSYLAEKKIQMESDAKASEGEIAEARKALGELLKEKEKTEESVKQLEAELEKANKANKVVEEEKNRVTQKISKISEKREVLSHKIESLEKDVNEINVQQSRNHVRLADLEEEITEYKGVPFMEKFSLNDLKKSIPGMEGEIEAIGPINMKALSDFEPFKKEVEEMRGKAGKLEDERKAVLEMVDKINVRKFSVFMECFSQISKRFSELYYNFFGGEGLLELADPVNPFDGGLHIQAKYKGGTMKSIDAMSGGEKSLTALAFLFAIQSYEPAPFYILDEVDAALDKENSAKVANMIKGMAGTSQFISISHNDALINQADQIIGVALNKQKSSVIGLRLRKEGNGHLTEADVIPKEAG